MANNLRAAHNNEGSSDKVYLVGIIQYRDGSYDVVAKWGKRPGSPGSHRTSPFPPRNRKVYHTCSSRGTAENCVDDMIRAKTKKSGYKDVESSDYSGVYDIVRAQADFEAEQGTIIDKLVPSKEQSNGSTKAPTPLCHDCRHWKNGIGVYGECMSPVHNVVGSDCNGFSSMGAKPKASRKSKSKKMPKLDGSEEIYELTPDMVVEDVLAEDEFLVVCIDATGEKTKGGMNIKNGYDEGQEFIACPSILGSDYISVEDRYGKNRSCPAAQFERVKVEA